MTRIFVILVLCFVTPTICIDSEKYKELLKQFGDEASPKNKSDDSVSSKAAAMCRKYAERYNQEVHIYNNACPNCYQRGGPQPMEFLHMALLGYGDRPAYLCGGTLISEKFVLSAAHCETSSEFGPVSQVLLADSPRHPTEHTPSKSHSVLRRYVHKDYTPGSFYNDIMLLELVEDVKISRLVVPVCLQVDKHIAEDSGILTGWGRTEAYGPPGDTFHKVRLPFVNADKCREGLRGFIGTNEIEFRVSDEIQICAGDEEGQDACLGDSGGPLQILLHEKMYQQVGIVSSGEGFCGRVGSPGLYTRVSAYVPWIESIVWPEPSNHSSKA